MTDYAELWLQAQRAHKDVFEAALRKDWDEAITQSVQLEEFARRLRVWFIEQESK
jgi:hypothetical protein